MFLSYFPFIMLKEFLGNEIAEMEVGNVNFSFTKKTNITEFLVDL